MAAFCASSRQKSAMPGIKTVSIAAEIREIRSLLTALLSDPSCG